MVNTACAGRAWPGEQVHPAHICHLLGGHRQEEGAHPETLSTGQTLSEDPEDRESPAPHDCVAHLGLSRAEPRDSQGRGEVSQVSTQNPGTPIPRRSTQLAPDKSQSLDQAWRPRWAAAECSAHCPRRGCCYGCARPSVFRPAHHATETGRGPNAWHSIQNHPEGEGRQ